MKRIGLRACKKITVAFIFLQGLTDPFACAWTLVGSGIKGWDTKTLTINVNTTSCGIGDTTLYDLIDRAMVVWNENPTADLKLERSPLISGTSVSTFKNGQATDVPLILCSTNFTSDIGDDGNVIPASTMQLAASTKTLALVYGGILLNAESGKSANIANLSSGVLAVTLAHEIGHLVGLGHSSSSDALMYFSMGGKTSPFITQDDMDGFSFLYPKDEFKNGAFGCAAVHRYDVGIGITGGFAGWFLALLILGRICGAKQCFLKRVPLSKSHCVKT